MAIRTTAGLGLAVLVMVAAAAAPARADAALDAVVKQLDAVEAGYEDMAPGDRALAADLIRKNNAAVKDLGAIRERDEAWKAQYDRARDLDKKIRARMSEPAPPDDKLLAARAKLDEVEKALPALKAGDVPAANALIATINAAVEDLKASKARGTEAWNKEAQRTKEYDQKARTLAAQKPEGGTPAGGGSATPPPSGGGSSAAAGELPFNDKRLLKFLDRDLERLSGYVQSSPPTEFQNQANVDSVKGKIDKLNDTLNRLQSQGHPEIEARRQQVADLQKAFAAKHTAAFSSLGAEDKRQLGMFRQRITEDQARLAEHQGTVLLREGGTRFDHPIQAQAGYLAKLQNKGHDDVKAAIADHEAFKKAVEERAAESRKKAEALGDVRARLGQLAQDFGSGSGYPPALPRNPGEAEIKAFSNAAKSWKQKLDAAVAYLHDVQAWSPEYQDVDFGNRLRRWLSEKPHQLPKAVESVDGYFDSRMKPGLEWVDVGAVKKSTLRDAAWRPGKPTEVQRLEEAIEAGKGWKAFQAEFRGKADPALDGTVADLEGRLAAFHKAVADQLASERCPTQDGDFDPALLEIAKKTVKAKYARIEPYHGKKSRLYEKIEDSVIYKWDYDFFSCHLVINDEESGQPFVWLYVFAYYRSGNRVELNKWVVSEAHRLHRILPENVSR